MNDKAKGICHTCHKETNWMIVHRLVSYHGICHCFKCSECGREVPDFAFGTYQETGKVLIPV